MFVGVRKTHRMVIDHHLKIEEDLKARYSVERATTLLCLDGAMKGGLKLWEDDVPYSNGALCQAHSADLALKDTTKLSWLNDIWNNSREKLTWYATTSFVYVCLSTYFVPSLSWTDLSMLCLRLSHGVQVVWTRVLQQADGRLLCYPQPY